MVAALYELEILYRLFQADQLMKATMIRISAPNAYAVPPTTN